MQHTAAASESHAVTAAWDLASVHRIPVCSRALPTKHLPVFHLIDNGRTATANRGADERTFLPTDERADARAGSGRAADDEQALLP